MQIKNKPHIGFIFPDYFQEEYGTDITKVLEHEKLNIDIRQKETQLWGSIEWMVPGLFAVYLFKPYFEGFLSEAGKDHYQYLKTCFGKLLKETKGMPVKTLTSIRSGEKINSSNTQSKAVSIHIELKNNIKLKIMFDNELSKDDWLNSLNNILDTVLVHYEEYPNDELSVKLEKLDAGVTNEIYAVINKRTKKWDFFNMEMAVKKSRTI